MPVAIEPSKISYHPAVRAWMGLHPSVPPRSVEVWSRGSPHKAAVYRLVFRDRTAPAVFAKRGAGALLDVERIVHERILPGLPLPSPRCLGALRDADGDVWLFLEDVGDRCIDPRDRSQAALAGSWLARLHVAAAGAGNGHGLPDGGPGRYLAHLRSARERIATNLGNPGLAAGERVLLSSVLRQLDRIESSFERLVAACEGIPPTLVHGDFQTKNVRIRDRKDGPELLALDWEMAGWGIPVVDLADAPTPSLENQVDLHAYLAVVGERWPDLSVEALRRMAAVGFVLRRLAAIDWEATNLRFTERINLVRPLSCFLLYDAQLATGLDRLAPWVG